MSSYDVTTKDFRCEKAFFDGLQDVDFDKHRKHTLNVTSDTTGEVKTYRLTVKKNGDIDVKQTGLVPTLRRFFTFSSYRSDTEHRLISETHRVRALKTDDNWAKEVLSRPESRETVRQLTNWFADMIESSPFVTDKEVQEHVHWMKSHSASYPVSNLAFDLPSGITKAEYVRHLRALAADPSNDSHIKQLADIWRLPTHLTGHVNPRAKNMNDVLYQNDIRQAGRHHEEPEYIEHETKLHRLGNTQILDEQCLMRNLIPRTWTARDYQVKSTNSPNSWINRLADQHKYVSGASGMANVACEMFELFSDKMDADKRQEVQDIVKAFIIASGSHSKEEVDYAYKLTMPLFNMPLYG